MSLPYFCSPSQGSGSESDSSYVKQRNAQVAANDAFIKELGLGPLEKVKGNQMLEHVIEFILSVFHHFKQIKKTQRKKTEKTVVAESGNLFEDNSALPEVLFAS